MPILTIYVGGICLNCFDKLCYWLVRKYYMSLQYNVYEQQSPNGKRHRHVLQEQVE
jgi:hypothetical protein